MRFFKGILARISPKETVGTIQEPPPLEGDPKHISEYIEENVVAYLQFGKERLASQENLNREFSTKALGITTFGATLFAIGASRDLGTNINWVEGLLLILLGLCTFGIAALALHLVVKPKRWEQPFELSEIYNRLGKMDPATLTLTAAYMYECATGKNHETLTKRAFSLKCLTYLALLELAVFVGLLLVSLNAQ